MPSLRRKAAGILLRPWCALPATAVLTLAVLTGAHLLRTPPQRTVSELRSEIRDIVLQPAHHTSDSGGMIGPWHVAAKHFDESTSEFHDFRLRGGSVNVAAARATLRIDAERDAFSFTLHDVVLMHVTEAGDDPASNGPLITLDSFLLGPAQYHGSIVAD